MATFPVGRYILRTRSARKIPLTAGRSGNVLVALTLAGAVAGCEERLEPSREPPPPPPPRPSATAPQGAPTPPRDLRAWADDAGVATPTDPPAPAGDLAAEVEAFTTLAACVSGRAALDPLLADAVGALGYDTLALDACRALGAMKARSSKPCAPIGPSTVRGWCETMAAVAAGDPALCPLAPALGAGAREPVCLARARRDARFCGAALGGAREACRALVLGDASACGDDAACAREVARSRGLAKGAAAGKPFETHLRVQLVGEPGGVTYDLVDIAEGGAVVRRLAGGSIEIALGTARTAAWPAVAAADARPRAFVSVTLTPHEVTLREAEIAAPRARVELLLPGHPLLSSLAGVAPLRVRVGAIGAQVGDKLQIAVEGGGSDAGRDLGARLEIETFVRERTGK